MSNRHRKAPKRRNVHLVAARSRSGGPHGDRRRAAQAAQAWDDIDTADDTADDDYKTCPHDSCNNCEFGGAS